MRDPRLTVMADVVRHGRCRDCGQPLEWRMSSHAKWLPFDRHPLVLSVHENADTTVRFENVSPEALHFATCPNRPPRKRKRR